LREEKFGKEDASEVLLFASFYTDFFASVRLLLEIHLVEPDPVGTAARHVLFSRVSGVFAEVSDNVLV
jgi:hypothetical protein